MERKKNGAKFVVCVRNTGYRASLELCKIYRSVPDAKAARRNFLRVVDESGEDYLYPADYFVPIALPQAVRRILLKAS